MHTTKYLLSTIKEIPANTESISHQLMLRAGMIRMLSAGIYTWLPTGYRVLKKVIKIISNTMNQHGCLEICAPIIQPRKLWDQSGRTKLYGKELINLIDRRKKKYILSPTHEEAISYIFNQEIHSYKQLPIVFYQIQKKFRDEIRPRFGVIRSIEFLMKDAYSFHINKISLQKTYELIKEIYIHIFTQLKLDFKIIKADSKIMGGSISHEFHAISNIGEDKIIFSKHSNHAVHISKFNKKKNKIKIYLIKTKSNQSQYSMAALLMRKYDPLNVKDLQNINILEYPIKFIKYNKMILSYQLTVNKKYYNNENIFMLADSKIINIPYLIITNNWFNKKFTPILWNKRIIFNKIINVKNYDHIFYYDTNQEKLKTKNSIEIGHIFQIGKKYSKNINFSLHDKNHNKKTLHMGCYGVGINRIISSIIEQNHDNNGIIWPNCIAPFQVFIIPINMHKNKNIKNIAKSIYTQLIHNKIDVLFDNRKENLGKMFADMNLIGIPYGIIISDNTIKYKEIEFYSRKKNSKIRILISQITPFIKKLYNR
ncbi:Proline--tRNA ligase [Buchnera aphidicola (Cinara kochiana kochiana)]|uniref:Proline--tRNA ligase n=1 Tax=Buchnera aphidicola (Cinara kochiana kochiana) TaxID=2518976 RepID=A0A451D5U2_9GAMM|nr:proline--tRNA ligase [Buchnera aphidicola]VFP81074.1 Proline--tRNA ligase [Buchnera aphidicola (Cinara kochiana kochiana)]